LLRANLGVKDKEVDMEGEWQSGEEPTTRGQAQIAEATLPRQPEDHTRPANLVLGEQQDDAARNMGSVAFVP
jgi:hypothetical protein